MKIVRLFTNYKVPDISRLLGGDISTLEESGIEVKVNQSGAADLVVVLNTVTRPRWVFAPRNSIIKIVQEPSVGATWSHAFTYIHSRVFGEILTHSPNPKDTRQKRFIGYLPRMVASENQIGQERDRKQSNISVISSILDILTGHRLRLRFVEKLLESRPDLRAHTFGRGRDLELSNKDDGLASYRYSIAIENWSSKSYITEKFTDCILMGAVPLYFGAEDVGQYFPEKSFIWLPIENFGKCLEILETLGPEDYLERLPSLIEARKLIESRYCLTEFIKSQVLALATREIEAKKLIVFPRIDGVLYLMFFVAVWIGKLVPRGLRNNLRRRLF
jgi:hypothetical protein